MRKCFLLFLVVCLFTIGVNAQKKESKIASTSASVVSNVDSTLFSKIKFRQIGPFRGGRSAAVAGSYKNKMNFYFGSTGGGVWKTNDGGSNWKNISGSITN